MRVSVKGSGGEFQIPGGTHSRQLPVVDSITQAALGAAVGEAVLGKHLGNRALLWGALFGTLPDLDVVFSPFFDTAGNLAHHRGASHSLLVMTLASFLLARWLAKLWKKEKVGKARAGAFVFLAWSTHVLIDCFTVYGTSVLWPFSDVRVAFNHLFIVDPFYTGPLLVTLVWLAFLRGKKNQPKRRRLCYWGLGLSSAYVLLSVAMKFHVSAGFDRDLARRSVSVERRMEAPTPFNILLWRSVADQGDAFWVGYRSIFEFPSTPVRWTVYPKETAAAFPHAATREMRVLHHFSGGWWIARPHAKGVWIGDMRFGEMREWGAREGTVDNRLVFSWLLDAGAPGDKLKQKIAERRGMGETLGRLAWRIAGRRDRWDGLPRLAGVPGSLPEFLHTIE